ncbi:ROK family protein [Terricaulis silvestris]|uniref:Fructokinase n=1 Tax=Terricaulis silvestris TaxID=2686094 RepID=A0A6I6ML22_9CAUL|nr:ROK family protein [Terricaulis silvestris]QGZ94721.1 Fructokinase [Terricaulis silvestris]
MRLGVDFGGTKIEGALLDSKGEILVRQRVPNPGDYHSAVRALADLTARIEQAAGARADTVGVALPGSLSPKTGMIRNANSVWMNGKPFLEDLKVALGRPVRVENDANCFALSEAVDGAAAGGRVVFGVIIGTGCGGGVVVDRKVVTGANAIGGEWGHTPLPWPREDEKPVRDWCGRWGCLEQWISGTGFKRWAGMSAGDADKAAQAGDPKARVMLDLLADRISRSLAVVIDILDPDVIVFGGGVSNVESLYPSIRGKLLAHIFSDVLHTRLVQNKHGDSSGVRGAAWLFTAEEAA